MADEAEPMHVEADPTSASASAAAASILDAAAPTGAAPMEEEEERVLGLDEEPGDEKKDTPPPGTAAAAAAAGTAPAADAMPRSLFGMSEAPPVVRKIDNETGIIRLYRTPVDGQPPIYYEVTRRQATISDFVFRAMSEDPNATSMALGCISMEESLAAIVEYMKYRDGLPSEAPLKPLATPRWIERDPDNDDPNNIGNTLEVLKDIFALPPQKVVDTWLVEFFRKRMYLGDRHANLIDLLCAADYMVIPDLVNATAAVHAGVQKDRTDAEIREFYDGPWDENVYPAYDCGRVLDVFASPERDAPYTAEYLCDEAKAAIEAMQSGEALVYRLIHGVCGALFYNEDEKQYEIWQRYHDEKNKFADGTKIPDGYRPLPPGKNNTSEYTSHLPPARLYLRHMPRTAKRRSGAGLTAAMYRVVDQAVAEGKLTKPFYSVELVGPSFGGTAGVDTDTLVIHQHQHFTKLTIPDHLGEPKQWLEWLTEFFAQHNDKGLIINNQGLCWKVNAHKLKRDAKDTKYDAPVML